MTTLVHELRVDALYWYQQVVTAGHAEWLPLIFDMRVQLGFCQVLITDDVEFLDLVITNANPDHRIAWLLITDASNPASFKRFDDQQSITWRFYVSDMAPGASREYTITGAFSDDSRLPRMAPAALAGAAPPGELSLPDPTFKISKKGG